MGQPKYQINYDFFNEDSEQYWYFLGLISSDGYISDNTIELCLNKKDEHILINIEANDFEKEIIEEKKEQ